MKRYAFFALITILALTTLACSITFNAPEIRTTTGPTQAFTVNETAPADPAKLTISMGAGKINLSGGGESFINGEVRYNVEQFKPTITRGQDSVSIKQETENLPSAIGKDVINEWNLKLGTTATALTINAGAYEGDIDLSGVPLTNLKINDGASKAKVMFNSANPEVMEELTYKTGASQVELLGLGNANFKQMTFGGGAGSYTLDFTGKLQQEAKVNISAGVSSIKVTIPASTNCRVEVTGGLNNIEPKGTWNVNDKVYEIRGDGPQLNIRIDMGVGNLELISQ
jgi:hypothetical protein